MSFGERKTEAKFVRAIVEDTVHLPSDATASARRAKLLLPGEGKSKTSPSPSPTGTATGGSAAALPAKVVTIRSTGIKAIAKDKSLVQVAQAIMIADGEAMNRKQRAKLRAAQKAIERGPNELAGKWTGDVLRRTKLEVARREQHVRNRLLDDCKLGFLADRAPIERQNHLRGAAAKEAWNLEYERAIAAAKARARTESAKAAIMSASSSATSSLATGSDDKLKHDGGSGVGDSAAAATTNAIVAATPEVESPYWPPRSQSRDVWVQADIAELSEMPLEQLVGLRVVMERARLGVPYYSKYMRMNEAWMAHSDEQRAAVMKTFEWVDPKVHPECALDTIDALPVERLTSKSTVKDYADINVDTKRIQKQWAITLSNALDRMQREFKLNLPALHRERLLDESGIRGQASVPHAMDAILKLFETKQVAKRSSVNRRMAYAGLLLLCWQSELEACFHYLVPFIRLDDM